MITIKNIVSTQFITIRRKNMEKQYNNTCHNNYTTKKHWNEERLKLTELKRH